MKRKTKYGGVEGTKQSTWKSLLDTANNDFISVIILWYSGVMPGSTYAWMFPHTVEKYLKAYLLKNQFVKLEDLGKYGHDINKLWEKFKDECPSHISKCKLNDAFDQLVEDLSTIHTNLRYDGGLDYSSGDFLYFYIVLCSFLRYLIIGKTKYRGSFYGLEKQKFIPMCFAPVSKSYGEVIVEKVLHLVLEHGISLTNLGQVNIMGIEDFSISNTAMLQKLKGCPICEEQEIDSNRIIIIEFYRNLFIEKLDV